MARIRPERGSYILRMSFSENRYHPRIKSKGMLFRIMLYDAAVRDFKLSHQGQTPVMTS